MESNELETPEITQPEVGSEIESNEPTSMLEAIESGLNEKAEEQQVESEGRSRDETGRFAAKQAEKAAETERVAPEDDLAMPEGLSQKAQERFTTLVNRVKEREAQAQEVGESLGQFREMIRSTGTSPQEFSHAIDYMRMVKHGDFDGALRIMDEQRRMLSLAMGRPLAGADPLAQFPDLRQRVDGYQMDEQSAIELARTRMYQQQAQQAQQAEYQSQQSQQQNQQQRQQAIGIVDQLGQQWSRTDPDFAAKEDVILKQLPEIARNFPPTQWPQQVKMLYSTLSAMPRPQPVSRTPSPLRSSGQSAGARQPSSMLEAMEIGLGYAGG